VSVYLTRQKNVGVKSWDYDKTIAIQYCGNRPFELALRFANCSLLCGACFASGYSWGDRYSRHKRVSKDIPLETIISDYQAIPQPVNSSYNWLRILGGEPLISDENINYIFDFLTRVASTASKFNNAIVIQTNGIYIGKGNTKVLHERLLELHRINPDIFISIEISIKGTNPQEFALISRSNPELYDFNLKAYQLLKDLELPNLRPTIVAGFGITESYLLTEGKSQRRVAILSRAKKPIYHPDHWDEKFSTLYHGFLADESNPVTGKGRMPMYGIGDSDGWQERSREIAARLYRDQFLDTTSQHTSPELEQYFQDILGKFFLVSNQEYYSTITRN
jgi:uncharacterized Fe-S cluster-containing radical SAM superfamily protein